MTDNSATIQDELKKYESFDEMGLKDDLIRGVYSYGFENPSKIQQLAIVPMSKHTDILAQSQSGTGKTGAFTIGSLSVVDTSIKAPQVLVLCPTRELSQQTERVAKALGSYMGLKVLSATGGNQLRNDISTLKAGAQFIVGTPGRIFDLIRRGDLSVEHIKYVILDEADQMLEDLFAEQIKAILDNKFPSTTRLALFSATMPQNVIEIAEHYLSNPARMLLPPDEVTLDGIKQYYVELEREDWKLPVLLDLYQQIAVNQALIYVNKRQKAEWLAKQLSAQGFTLEYIHGEMEVGERKKRMDDFRSGTVRVLISTDLLARGIDVQQVSLVVNYELPVQRENYVHRIGRSGRYGKKGVAVNLVYGDERNTLKEIERHYSTTISELPEDLASLSVSN
uniref:RNA helicase n=1 Tax=viral metagenome TaxID=1070528 RepID=A0A6C0DVK7_9ZZZZ